MHREEKPGMKPMAKPSEPINSDGRVSRHFASKLAEFAVLVGPTLFVLAVCQVTIPDHRRETIELLVAAALLTGVFWFEPLIKRRLKVTIPAALAVVLGVASFHFMMKPARQLLPKELPTVTKESTSASADDPWVIWEQQVRQDVEKCNSNDHTCIALAISKKDYPPPNSHHPVDQLNADIRAGSILMSIHKVFDMLDKRIGVKENFLGDGLALPLDEKRYYSQPRVPEYLVENHRDTHPDIWTWEVTSPADKSSKDLTEILKGDPIPEIKGRGSQEDFLGKIEGNVRRDDQPPAVIRFGRFPRRDYSGRLGPNDAKRVFMLRLRDVYDLKLGQASHLSGYSLEPSAGTSHKSLWIWVYLPTNANDLVRPTWDEIIPHIAEWLAK